MRKILIILGAILIIFSEAYAYTDISSQYWAYNQINTLSEKNILSGYPEGDFRPDQNMTKAEFISILYRVLGLKADVSSVSDHWASGYIEEIYKRKIIDFSEYSNFNPDNPITRWEICKMIVNSFDNLKNTKIIDGRPVFNDIELTNIEEKHVAKILKETGVLTGYPDGSVKFGNTSSRAEVCCFIYGLINSIEEIKAYGRPIIYEDNVIVSNIKDKNIKLKKFEFAKDEEYCTTILSNISIFEFAKGEETQYKDVFNKISSESHPYLAYRNKFGKDKFVIAIDFKTKNNTADYDILTGHFFLNIFFEEEDIKIIDSFDINEIECQIENNPYIGQKVKPGETQDTSAFYVINTLPTEKIRINRPLTTLYDSKDGTSIDVESFHSSVIYL